MKDVAIEGMEKWLGDPAGLLLSTTLLCAIDDCADEIHLQPRGGDLVIWFRVNQELHEVSRVPAQIQAKLMDYLQRLGGGGGQQRARVHLRLSNRREYNLRVSRWPTAAGEKVVVSFRPGEIAPPNLTRVGLNPEQFRQWTQLLSGQGLVLVAGPPNSGRSWTLLSSLAWLSSTGRPIITLENPVERRIPNLAQVDIQQQGTTFVQELARLPAEGAPQVVVVSEIPDVETARMALQMARSGHLLLSSWDAESSSETLWQLSRWGLEAELLDCLRGVCSQRLAPGLCPDCREPRPAPPHLGLSQVFHPLGCPACSSGFRGQLGLFEIMSDLPPRWWKCSTASQIRQLALDQGLRSLREDGLDKVRQGLLTLADCPRE